MFRSTRAVLLAACSILVIAACQSQKPEDRRSEAEAVEEVAPAEPEAPLSSPPAGLPAPAAPPSGGAMTREAMADASADASIAMPAPQPGTLPATPQPPLQAGTLTAGDYDDVLNPGLYRRYLEEAKEDWQTGQKELPYVDAEKRVTVKVVDRLGKPVPFADVQVAMPSGRDMFQMKTGANGTVYLYPGFDAIEAGTRLRAGTSADVPNATGSVSKTVLENGGTVTLALTTDAPKITKMDVLLTLDATGSMTDEMRYLQAELDSIFRRLKSKYPGVDLRAGLIVYRDHGDEYVTRDFGFSSDIDSLRGNLAAQSAYDGGDMPEAMDVALEHGLSFEWRSDAVKVNLLVADAPPHDEDIEAAWNSALMSRVKGIHIVPVAASGVDPTAEFMMRAMGQLTNGRYIFLTDDSGVGNPHAEPKVDCYVVTRLNGLVERVLISLMTGSRVEPEGSEVIRTVGDYKAGVCKASNQ